MPRVWKRSAIRCAVTALGIAGVVAGHLSGLPVRRPASPGPPSVSLLASESLIMTGTGMPDVTAEWMSLVSGNFITPTAGAGYVPNPVATPAQFRPLTGLASLSLDASTRMGSDILDRRLQALIDANRASGSAGDPIVVFGYSQSAWIASIEKRIMASRQAPGEGLPPVTFVVLANPIRPNGGVFSRFPALGIVSWTPVISAPTDTPFRTYDIARQYDFFADFPADPSNVLAVVNAVFGLMNHDYSDVTLNPDDPRYDPGTVVQQYGDTTYYLIPSKLPMLEPMRQGGFGPVADVLEPVLTPIVESGYDRTAPYGQDTPYGRGAPAAPGSDVDVDVAKLARDLNAAVKQSLATMAPAPAPAAVAAERSEPALTSRRPRVVGATPAGSAARPPQAHRTENVGRPQR